MKRQNRKGFTLAELLIVVAIIAVLVAIAVPLFVGGVKKAQEARDDANIRSVKSEAAVYLLMNADNKELWPDHVDAFEGTEPDKEDATPSVDLLGWNVKTATINADGSITINASDIEVIKNEADKPTEAAKATWGEGGVCTVTNVYLTLSEVKTA